MPHKRPPAQPHPDRKKAAFKEIQKKGQADARKQLLAAEARARTAIEGEVSALHAENTEAHNTLQEAIKKNEFVIVEAPTTTAPQVATNRFGLFGSAISSIGNFASTCASYLNPFKK